MKRFYILASVLIGVLLFAVAGIALAGSDCQKNKEKPKDAATLDDRTATVTETVDGKEKQSKIELKYSLKVKGYFDSIGFNIEEVEEDGPATKLANGAGAQAAGLEKGDIIAEVDGKPVKSPKDYAKAMNGASDHAKVKVKVRDVNTGKEAEFFADTAKR